MNQCCGSKTRGRNSSARNLARSTAALQRALSNASPGIQVLSSIATPIRGGVISAGAWYSMLLFDSVAAPGADDDAVFCLIRCPGRHCCSVSITVELAGLRRIYSAVNTHASTSVVRIVAGGTLLFFRQAQSAPGSAPNVLGSVFVPGATTRGGVYPLVKEN